MSRRRWLATACALAALCAPGVAALTPAALLVTVGDVTATSAVLWARSPAPGPVTVEYGPLGGADVRGRITADRAHDLTGTLRIGGLSAATRYRYRLAAHGEKADGEFVTAPAPDADTPVRFVWSGDLGGQGVCRRVDIGYPIFDTMARARPDFFLFLGDTIYADSRCAGPGIVEGGDFIATTLGGYRDKHRYNRADPAVQRFFRGTSVYAIWDDHEVRNDFAGPSEPLMAHGRRAFLEYWPILPPPEEPGRLYRRVRWGRLLELFILDTRQYRSRNAEPDGPGKTMLGAAQRRWLVDGVTSSTAVWKVVASSVPMSVSRGEVRDAWSSASLFGIPQEGAGFATERDAIFDAFRTAGVTNLVVLTGDFHYAQLLRVRPSPRWTFHELMAGPLSARQGRPLPLDDGMNPQSIFARGNVNNFGEISIDARGLTVTFIADDGATLFTHRIARE